MGLIKAALEAGKGVLADQWREFFYCDSLDKEVLMVKGQKRVGAGSSNTKARDNIISNGSVIAVADGQCMIIVEQGKIVEVSAEPGGFVYDSSTEPSIFAGNLGESIKNSFQAFARRFTFGGDTGKDQRVYYFNTKEIMDNKFGTPTPFMFDVVNKRIGMSRTVQVRCNGVYSYKITDPILFYKEVAANVADQFVRSEIDNQLKTEFIDALQPAFAALSELELRPSQIPGKTKELKQAMNEALKVEWAERRGITVQSIALNPISLTEEDMKKINQMEDAATMGSNPFMMAGRMTDATANAMETAAGNQAGAMTGFIGMGMAMPGGAGGGFNAAQNLYNAGMQNQQMYQQQQAQQQQAQYGQPQQPQYGQPQQPQYGQQQYGQPQQPFTQGQPQGQAQAQQAPQQQQVDNVQAGAQEVLGWACSCGSTNQGKFCTNCGSKKPEGAPLYRCDKCGWKPADPHNPPKFCQECGDPFDDADVQK